MKIATLALFTLAGLGAGCAGLSTSDPVPMSALPDCFESNFDRKLNLFTLNGAAGRAANQQCLLNVQPAGAGRSATRITAGAYTLYLANGGGGGAGGTIQGGGGGGGGGGGAGAKELRATVILREGSYVLTIGAGGPGGSACMPQPYAFGGGPGWAGSPSNLVRVDTGQLLAGVPGAGTYVRPTRASNEKSSGENDGHGGSGPGQASGGHGGFVLDTTGASVAAKPGQSVSGPGGVQAGGDPGVLPTPTARSGAGGGGGATSFAEGGDGGGEMSRRRDSPPERGQLGSGGGGGEGSSSQCDPGAAGGHGYIALRPM